MNQVNRLVVLLMLISLAGCAPRGPASIKDQAEISRDTYVVHEPIREVYHTYVDIAESSMEYGIPPFWAPVDMKHHMRTDDHAEIYDLTMGYTKWMIQLDAIDDDTTQVTTWFTLGGKYMVENVKDHHIPGSKVEADF